MTKETKGKKKKDLIEKPKDEVIVQSETGSLGAGDEFHSEDILIPKIFLSQKNSNWVEKEKAKKGDFINSMTEEIIGSNKKPIIFLPFAKYKTLQIKENGNWVATKDWHPSMKDLPYEEILEGGVKRNNQPTLNYLVIKTDEITQIDENTYVAMPYVIQFKGGSAKAGRSIETNLKNLSMFKKPSWFKTIELTCSEETNKNNQTYLAWNVKQGETATVEMQKAAALLCDQWNQNKDKFKVDAKEDNENEETVAPEMSTSEAKKDIKF